MITSRSGILFLALAFFSVCATAQTIFVSPTGNDANPGTAALPKATVQGGVDAAVNGSTVKVAPGTYSGTISFSEKTITLEGAANIGDPKPILAVTTGGTNQSILAMNSSPGVTIRGFQFNVDQTFVGNVITTIGIWDNLVLSDLLLIINGSNTAVRSGGPTNPTHGLQIDGSNVTSLFPSVTLTNITIEPTVGVDGANTWYVDRGILLRSVKATVGGSTTLGCSLKCARDILLQFVGGGATIIEGNTFTGGGIDVTLPAVSASLRIANNNFLPDPRGPSLIADVLLLKHNANQARIDVVSNQFRGFSNVALRSGGVANAFIQNNTFIPSDSASSNYRCIEVNTQWEGTTQIPTVPNSISITGNTFLPAATGNVRGIAVFLKNERAGAVSPDYSNVTIGGVGALANQFSENIGKFIRLDNALSRAFSLNLDGSENLYTINGTQRRPLDMSQADLFRLENKIDHGIDDNTLGFVRVRNRAAFVTPRSFFQPNTSLADVQRAINLSGGSDTVHIQDTIYTPPVTIDKDLTFKPSGARTILGDLTMATPGGTDELRIENTMSLAGSLTLNQGNIKVQAFNLRILTPTATSPPPGTDNSYVVTDGIGKLVLVGVGSTPRNFPIGTATAFRPVIVANGGIIDTVSLRIRPQVLSLGTSGTPLDTVVDFTWFFSEGTPGGGNYTFRPQWRAIDERPDFFRDKGFLQRFQAGRWEFLTGPVRPVPVYLPIAGVDPFTATASNLTQSFSFDTPLRIYAPIEIPDTIFYVDGVDGVDNAPTFSGRTPERAWKTINYAVTNATRVAPSGFIFIHIKNVAPAYDESINIPSNKGSMVIQGGYSGLDPAVAVSNTTSGLPVLSITADSVYLNKLSIRLGLSGARTGIQATTKFNFLDIDSCQVRNIAGAPLGTGVELVAPREPARISITASQFIGDQANGPLENGLVATDIFGQIGGRSNLVNRFAATNAIDVSGVSGGLLTLRDNTIQSSGKAIRLSGGNGSATVIKNTINNGIAVASRLGIQVYSFTDAGQSIRVDSNNVTADTCLHIVNNAQAVVTNNLLTAQAIAVHLNSGIAGATLTPYVSNNITLTGNTLNTTGTPQIGLLLGNEAKAQINPAYNTLSIGTQGAPNSFGPAFTRFIEMQSTLGKEFETNIDIVGNLYGVVSGTKTPAAMTQPELFATEDKIVHKIDFADLGLARLRNNELYVTPRSFIAPRTTSPALQRTVTPSADGDRVFIQDGDYPDTTTIDKNLTFTSVGNTTRHRRMELNGADKVLTLVNDFTIYGGLNFSEGKIKLTTNNLILTPTCPQPTGGSPLGYVWTDGTGGLLQQNVGPGGKVDSIIYPIGRASIYNPIFLRNRGTIDNFRVRLLDDVFTLGINGGVVPDSVVKASWIITEEASGGSILSVTPQWAGAQEKAEFDREKVGVQGFFGGIWLPDEVLPRIVSGNDPYTVNRSFTGRSFSETAVRVISLPPLKDEVFIPQLFTPNGDGTNDFLLVYSNTIASIKLRIFNRYGNIVYETSDVTEALTKGWDGKKGGSELNSDTYVWTISGFYKNGKPLNVLGKNTGYVILSR
jgi:gliding motility-associated-like protein